MNGMLKNRRMRIVLESNMPIYCYRKKKPTNHKEDSIFSQLEQRTTAKGSDDRFRDSKMELIMVALEADAGETHRLHLQPHLRSLLTLPIPWLEISPPAEA